MTTSPDLLTTALQMLVALMVMGGVLAIVLYLSRRLQRYRFDGQPSNFIRVLETRYLAVKKSVTLVEIPGAVLVIGISDNDLCLLDKITDPQYLRQFEPDQAAPAPTSFSEQLHKVMRRLRKA